MKILSTEPLALPEVKVITYRKFPDERGYFTESFRREEIGDAVGPPGVEIVQINESFSRGGVLRGLHAQWNPHQGKLVRPLAGHLIDLALDIRKGAPTYGKIVACELRADPESVRASWVWVPPGFAHGTLFPRDTTIEYLCTGAWSPGCELSILPDSDELDWSLCEPMLAARIKERLKDGIEMSGKDREGFTLAAYGDDPISEHFTYAPEEDWSVADKG